jgi:hypothetical protein
MPTSPSPRRAASPEAARRAAGPKTGKRGAPPPPAPRPLWPKLAAIGVLAIVGVVLAALPASLAARFLPPNMHADDFSGTVWHGSVGRLTAGGRDVGAIEWHLHPAALFRLRAAADLHWVKGGFVLDGTADAGRGNILATDIQGGGSIADLRDFGIAPGWRGTVSIKLQKLSADLTDQGVVLKSAVGEIDAANVSSPQVAAGNDLGGYALTFNDTAIGSDGQASAALADTGGPLSLNANITLTPAARTGLLSGTVQERGDASEPLRRELAQLAQMHARDAQGRIPVDLEFSY